VKTAFIHREKRKWKCGRVNSAHLLHREKIKVAMWEVHSAFLYTEKRSDKWEDAIYISIHREKRGKCEDAIYMSIHRENRVAMCDGTLNISIHREKIRVAMWEGTLCSELHREQESGSCGSVQVVTAWREWRRCIS
jgi:hypothetical protein